MKQDTEFKASLHQFFEGIDEFCTKNLNDPRRPHEDVPEEFVAPHSVADKKIIADPIEKYPSFLDWEIQLIDTPLLQRLRNIRQLGLKHLVYPSLNYDRFVHSIGVMGRLEQIRPYLDASYTEIGKKGKKERNLHKNSNVKDVHAGVETGLFDDKTWSCLRLAALFHDVGHCLFSHTSEDVIHGLPGRMVGLFPYPSVKIIRETFSKYLFPESLKYGQRPKMPAIAEIFSFSIVTSKPFIDFMTKLNKVSMIPGCSDQLKSEDADYFHDFCWDAGFLIMGLPMRSRPRDVFLSQLLSSAFDIDKMDYMFREALYSGLSLGISLDWMMNKLSVEHLSAKEMPESLLTRTKNIEQKIGKERNYRVLALHPAGQFSFEEFCIARVSLHEKIYLHQKVRAIEADLRQRLILFAHEFPEYNEAHKWLYLSESILTVERYNIPNLENDGQCYEKLRKIGFPIFNRNLFPKRAYAFGWNNLISEPYTYDDSCQGFNQFMAETAANPSILQDAISREYEIISKLLREKGNISPAPKVNATGSLFSDLALEKSNDTTLTDKKSIGHGNENSEIYIKPNDALKIIVDPPVLSTLQQPYGTIHIASLDHFLHPQWSMPIDKIIEQYKNNRAIAYVFSSKDERAKVHLACETALFKTPYKLRFEHQEMHIAPDVLKATKRLKQKLREVGYYADKVDISEEANFNSIDGARRTIYKTAHMLSEYSYGQKSKVTFSTVSDFFAQFPKEHHSEALDLLDAIKFASPSKAITEAVKQVFSILKDNSDPIYFVRFPEARAAHISFAYDIRDLARVKSSHNYHFCDLRTALAKKAKQLIFYSDGVSRDKSIDELFAEWIGEPAKGKNGVRTLSAKELCALEKANIYFAFGFAPEGICDAILRKSRKSPFSIQRVLAGDVIKSHKRMFSVDFLRVLRNIGTELLMERGVPPKRASKDALGLGGFASTLIFQYGCLEITLPALYLSGRLKNGSMWTPLVEGTYFSDS